MSPGLEHLSLVVCGLSADLCVSQLIDHFPSLSGRLFARGFTDFELPYVYHNAFAVIIPSLIEGFGLPVLETLASGGLPLIADSRGLREAGSEAALRFPKNSSSSLAQLLLALDSQSFRSFLYIYLRPRISGRLSRLNRDLLGLALLANARLALHSY